MARSHKDLEFMVKAPWKGGPHESYYKRFADAMMQAAALSISRGGEPVYVDVLTWSQSAARAWGGDDAVEVYQFDPEASVHERIVVTAESHGRIP